MNTKHIILRYLLAMVVGVFVSTAIARPAGAQRKEAAPPELKGVDVIEHPNAQVPLELPFVDSQGDPVTLGQLFDGQRPVILTLNYSNCPMLCSLQLNGLFDALKAMQWDIGDAFQMITVSIDPLETPERAALTKRKYLKSYGRPGSQAAYHCLTGREEQIRTLADTVGFGYVYDRETNQYLHMAATFICTPDGRVSRYLYGVEYDPQTLKLSLLEAAEGKIGSSMDRVVLYCFQYDAESGRYGPSAYNLMRLSGVLTVFVFGCLLLWYWRREARKLPPARSLEAT